MEGVLSKRYIPAILAFLVLWWIASKLIEERKIRRLGGHAHSFKSWIPFGISFVWDGVKHALRDDSLRFWHKNFMRYGAPENPYTLEARTGGERIVFTCDPENIKAILASRFNDFGKGEEFNKDFHLFLGDGIFNTDGQKWHESRQLIRPQFIKDRVSDLDCFERHASVLIQLLGGQGQTVDVRDLFFRFTLDAATEFLLGRSVASLHAAQSDFAYAFARIQHIMSIIARTGPFKVLFPRGELKRHVHTLNAFVEPFIDDALALSPEELEKRTKSEHGYTFLHALASYTRDRKVLRDQLVNILLAGRDTTACTLSWLFWELSRNPEVVSDLRQEIKERVGFDRAPTYDDLKNMRYLQHTLHETLRLYPVVPFNIRISLRDTTLPRGGGPAGDQPVGVLKHTPIGYSTHYMQHTPEIYPETSETFPPPETFAPHRWEHWTPRPWTYIPFNGGPRICVGQNFALMEMGYTLTRILQRFGRIESRMNSVERSGKESTKRRWERRNPEVPDPVEKFVESRERMMSEIVLQPAREIQVAFYEA